MVAAASKRLEQAVGSVRMRRVRQFEREVEEGSREETALRAVVFWLEKWAVWGFLSREGGWWVGVRPSSWGGGGLAVRLVWVGVGWLYMR